MTNDEKGGMWRVIYSVSPRTPEGGQAGKGDKLPFLHIPSCRWLPSKEELMTNDERRMMNDEENVMKISCWLPSKGECSDGKKEG